MKRKKGGSSAGSWMNTYADMVTLLLCFFVLLYSISTVDEDKWKNFVLSLNPELAEQMLEEVHANGDQESGMLEEQESIEPIDDVNVDEFAILYEALLASAAQLGIQNDVSISQGDGYTFISFKDQVFFDGDSPVLKDEGKAVLDVFCEALRPAATSIKEIQVLGHTSQGNPDVPNEVITDRVLSAERSAQIVAYIQQKNFIDPVRLVGLAYGQFRPIDTFETREGRAHNRRAEILITKNGSVEENLDYYYKQVYGNSVYQEGGEQPGASNSEAGEAAEPPSAQQEDADGAQKQDAGQEEQPEPADNDVTVGGSQKTENTSLTAQ